MISSRHVNWAKLNFRISNLIGWSMVLLVTFFHSALGSLYEAQASRQRAISPSHKMHSRSSADTFHLIHFFLFLNCFYRVEHVFPPILRISIVLLDFSLVTHLHVLRTKKSTPCLYKMHKAIILICKLSLNIYVGTECYLIIMQIILSE